jgi:hypothetical protein
MRSLVSPRESGNSGQSTCSGPEVAGETRFSTERKATHSREFSGHPRKI